MELDTHLNWKSHIQKLSKKLSSFIYALQHLKRVTDFETALTAYYAFAYSRMSYGLVLWGQSSEVNKIFILQKKCVRILANIDQMVSCRPYFVKFKMLTLTSMYILESSKFVKKHFDLYTPKTDIRRNNRNLNKLKLPFSRMKIVTSSPHHMMIKIYNHLPASIKNLEKITLFTKHLKLFLTSKCFYNLSDYFEENTNEYKIISNK